jgi:hypothetical protein
MLQWVLERLFQLTPSLVSLSKDRRDLKDNALRAILHALDETYLYYRNIENGNSRDREVEAQLVRYWSAAAIPVRHIDSELAERCDRKSEYWLNPDSYNERKVADLGIELKSVRDAYRALLHPRRLVSHSLRLAEPKRQVSSNNSSEKTRRKRRPPQVGR